MCTGKITAIIPAAGCSSRMGSPKPLLKVGDGTVLEIAVALFLHAGIKDVRVVVGHGKELTGPVAKRAGARSIVNEHYERGMFSSVLAGLEALQPDTDAVFMLPVDVPLVSPVTIERLLMTHYKTPDKILVPSFKDRRGHPVLIPEKFFDAIKTWSWVDGLRGALRRFDNEKVSVSVDDRNILFDVDTPGDFQELTKRWLEGAGQAVGSPLNRRQE